MAAPVFGQREDLYNVKVVINGTDGKRFAWVFDKMTGGKAMSKDTKYRPANGTENELSLGGSKSVENVVVSTLMTYDMYVNLTWLIGQMGRALMHVHKQPLDLDGNPYGKALVYRGKLLEVEPPPTDSHSETAGILTLVQSTVTPVTTG